MNKNLTEVALRQNAIYIADEKIVNNDMPLNHTTSVLVANASKLGFGFSEELLKALNSLNVSDKKEILEVLKEVMGVDKNWTPLVKGWDEPTGESIVDHYITFFANLFPYSKGTKFECGHTIPDGTFPLERYNGCPYCGTPFVFDKDIHYGEGSKLKVLELWTDKTLEYFFRNLLSSKTALDATEQESLKTLLDYFPLPVKVEIEMKESLVLVVESLVNNDRAEEATRAFKTPQDIMRYLWYKHTGYLQLIQPKVLANRSMKNAHYAHNNVEIVKDKVLKELKLKYSRKECKMVASWINAVAKNAEASAELMHPKRGMWVRFIRALRLAEYSKKKGFENLAELLDVFYNKKYSVWQGELNKARTSMDSEKMFTMLKERPSVFARSLFSNMLWFGANETLNEFEKVSAKIPARLLLTLSMYAPIYFNKEHYRSVKPLGGVNKHVPANGTLELYDEEQLTDMVSKVEMLFLEEMDRRYAKEEVEEKTIYIEELLYKVPLSIGDRSELVQDMPSALMGTKFKVEGDKVRLFMAWGKDLPKQHLDMDLSCHVAYDYKSENCSYTDLRITGCKHSGDIQNIPHMIGTAEYIELDLEELEKNDAKHVTFTGNAYTSGELSPNMVIGWMNSKHKMKISKSSGVAYDPSCVQHQVRITQSLSKGIVFGLLDVKAREITWIEMSFNGQVVAKLDVKGVEALLAKLDSKMTVGALLEIKAKAQGLSIVDESEEAELIYDSKWVLSGAVTKELLVD